MRIMIEEAVFGARLSTKALGTCPVLVIDNSLALLPEDATSIGCVLVAATDAERRALGRAGFAALVEEREKTAT
jgi:hypothetical protein